MCTPLRVIVCRVIVGERVLMTLINARRLMCKCTNARRRMYCVPYYSTELNYIEAGAVSADVACKVIPSLSLFPPGIPAIPNPLALTVCGVRAALFNAAVGAQTRPLFGPTLHTYYAVRAPLL